MTNWKFTFSIQWWTVIIFLFIFITGIWIQFNLRKWDSARIIIWDVMGYHLYLPAVFIYDDLAELKFSEAISNAYKPTGDLTRFGIMDHSVSGRATIKYPIGVAVMNIPVFLAGHVAAMWSNGKHPTDGFSIPYQKALAIGNFLYVFIGLYFLFRFLQYYLSKRIALSTILVILFGTNLYHYAIFEPGMSHGYLFFLYSLGLLLTHQWYKNPLMMKSVALGSVIGLIVITRPTDIFFVFIPVLWILSVKADKIDFIKRNIGYILAAFITALLFIMLQLAYWKYSSGSWIFYSYGDEGFVFSDPYIWQGLFSYQKGWFVYTPLAILGFVGVYLMMKQKEMFFYAVPTLAYYFSSIYVLFSWWMWYYGGSFGCRVLIQSYAILALPMGYFLQKTWSAGKKWLRTALAVIVIAGICLNIFQTYQYHKAIIHWSCMSKDYYWKVFLKLKYDPEATPLLLDEFEVLTEMNNRLSK